MKKIAILLVLTTCSLMANPFAAVKKAFTGKAGWSVSIAAFGGAEASDYRTTRVALSCGAGREGNTVLVDANSQLNTKRFIGLKVATFVEPIAVESYLFYRMNDLQRRKWGKYFTIGNWVATGVVAGVAAHNRWISQEAGCHL